MRLNLYRLTDEKIEHFFTLFLYERRDLNPHLERDSFLRTTWLPFHHAHLELINIKSTLKNANSKIPASKCLSTGPQK